MVDVALVKPDCLGEAQADLAAEAVGTNASAAVASAFARGVSVHFWFVAYGAQANRLRVTFEEQDVSLRTSHLLMRISADHYRPVRIHRRVERRPTRFCRVTRALDPSSFRALVIYIRFKHENICIISSYLCQVCNITESSHGIIVGIIDLRYDSFTASGLCECIHPQRCTQ